MYLVYILKCIDDSFYTGYTDNIILRVKQHNRGEVKYTKNLRPVKLIYTETCSKKKEAIAREKQIKGWTRIKKYNLIKYGHPTKIKTHKK